MRLVREPIDALARMMSHPSPELGGSSAAMLAGILGLAMIRMALAVSAEKDEDDRKAIAALAELERLDSALAEKADRDRESFRAYLERVNAAAPDPSALQAASRRSLRALLDGADLLVQALEFSTGLPDRVAKSVESDLYGGAVLLDAAFSGVALAIRTSLRPDRMAMVRDHVVESLDALDARRKKAYRLLRERAEVRGLRP